MGFRHDLLKILVTKPSRETTGINYSIDSDLRQSHFLSSRRWRFRKGWARAALVGLDRGRFGHRLIELGGSDLMLPEMLKTFWFLSLISFYVVLSQPMTQDLPAGFVKRRLRVRRIFATQRVLRPLLRERFLSVLT